MGSLGLVQVLTLFWVGACGTNLCTVYRYTSHFGYTLDLTISQDMTASSLAADAHLISIPYEVQ